MRRRRPPLSCVVAFRVADGIALRIRVVHQMLLEGRLAVSSRDVELIGKLGAFARVQDAMLPLIVGFGSVFYVFCQVGVLRRSSTDGLSGRSEA